MDSGNPCPAKVQITKAAETETLKLFFKITGSKNPT